MAINDIVQTIAEARVDARSLSEFVFKPAGFKVARRLAPQVDTLQFYIDRFDATVATIPNIVNDAINNTAVEGGVLADTFVTVNNSINQRQINMGFGSNSDIAAIANANIGMRVYSKAIASNYIFKGTSTSPVNDGTVLQGIGGVWEMELKEAYYASWFATPDVEEDQSLKLQVGYEYATSKGRPFIIDGHFWVSESNYHTEMAVYNSGASKTVIKVLSNSAIHFKEHSSLKLLSSDNTNYNLMLFFNVENVVVTKPKLHGDLLNHNGSAGEWGFGICIYNSRNVYIQQPEVYNMWGDGFYIGICRNTPASLDNNNDILIEYPVIDRVRRNGISLTSGANVRIIKPIIKNVRGTAPEASIDIEPENADGEGLGVATLVNCIIDSPTIIDCRVTLAFAIFGERHVDLRITGTTLVKLTKDMPVQPTGISVSTRPKDISSAVIPEQTGGIYVDNLIYTRDSDATVQYGAMLVDTTTTNLKVTFNQIDSTIDKDFSFNVGGYTQAGLNERRGITINNLNIKEGYGLLFVRPLQDCVFHHKIYMKDSTPVKMTGTTQIAEYQKFVFANDSHVSGTQYVVGLNGLNTKHLINNIIYEAPTDQNRIIRLNDDTRQHLIRARVLDYSTAKPMFLSGINYKGEINMLCNTVDGSIGIINTANTEITSMYGDWDLPV